MSRLRVICVVKVSECYKISVNNECASTFIALHSIVHSVVKHVIWILFVKIVHVIVAS